MSIAEGDEMAFSIRRVDYFNATVRDQPGAAYSLLSTLAEQGINLVAFTAVPGRADASAAHLVPR